MKDKSKHLWDYLTRKNPRLLQDPHFTSASVRRFFNHVYLARFDAGYTAAKENSAMNTGDSIWQTIFRPNSKH